MARFNPLLHVFDKLDAFGVNKARLILLLNDRRLRRLNTNYIGKVTDAIRLVNSDTAAFDKQIILDTLQQIVFHGEQPAIVEIEPGATFCFRVHPEDDVSYEGFKLLARDEETGVAVSDPGLNGTAQPEQDVTIKDLNFEGATLRRVNILLEQAGQGDAVFLITKVVLAIKRNIDTDA
jgi:hypothetical protein